jgi:hypothetical protein
VNLGRPLLVLRRTHYVFSVRGYGDALRRVQRGITVLAAIRKPSRHDGPLEPDNAVRSIGGGIKIFSSGERRMSRGPFMLILLRLLDAPIAFVSTAART